MKQFVINVATASMVQASVTMIKNRDNLTCGLEGVNINGEEAPSNLIFSYEMSFTDSGVYDPEFCKKTCVAHVQTSWDLVLGGTLCCSFIDRSEMDENPICAMVYASTLEYDGDQGYTFDDERVKVYNAMFQKPTYKIMSYMLY